MVKTWDINPNPEYRGFRCAKCQKYIKKAWHCYLKAGGYRTPVHFCNACQKKLVKTTSKEQSVYKTFTCDKCGGKMHRAYHIWLTEKGILKEIHLCKECANRFFLENKFCGVIYDLDGTLVSTQKLHEDAWLSAGKKFNIPISARMLVDQKGISNREAALMMLPRSKKYLLDEFQKAKAEYVNKNLKRAAPFPGVMETVERLSEKGYKVWICTSAKKDFVKKVLKPFKKLREVNTVWREMYGKEKPSPEALNLTLKKMGLSDKQVCYVGDAFNDYKTSLKAKVKFIYFCPDKKSQDPRIPKSIPVIYSHREIFKLIRGTG
jgi:HAD superfamily hydrolase (TIGR01549 family)